MLFTEVIQPTENILNNFSVFLFFVRFLSSSFCRLILATLLLKQHLPFDAFTKNDVQNRMEIANIIEKYMNTYNKNGWTIPSCNITRMSLFFMAYSKNKYAYILLLTLYILLVCLFMRLITSQRILFFQLATPATFSNYFLSFLNPKKLF